MILITGGYGFLGKHIRKLMPDALTPVSTEVDLLYPPDFVKYVYVEKPDKILHLAANLGGIKYNRDHQAYILERNLTMAITVFEAARMGRVDEVITIGSTCQYPASLAPPFKVANMWDGYPETTNGAYGLCKRMIYELGQAYNKQYGIKHKHIILANLYGPGDNFNRDTSHVIPALIDKVLNDKTVEVWGNGTAKREFLYVEDAAKIIVELVGESFTGAVNVGSKEVVTISGLVDIIQKVARTHKAIVYNDTMPNGQMERLLDSEYTGATPLVVGLDKTIKWFCLNKY